MALETVTHIADLVITNPTAADPKSQGDDHLRNIKTALRNDFAGFTGAVCVTGTDGGAADAYTLTPATALAAYGTKMIAVFSPVATNTGACTMNISGLGTKSLLSVSGEFLQSGDLVSGMVYAAVYDGTKFVLLSVTKNYVDQLSFSSVLPAQATNGGKVLGTNGTDAAWKSLANIGGASVVEAGDIAATQSATEAGASNSVVLTPANAKWHPSAAKAWLKCDANGSIAASYNIASIVDSGPGALSVSFSTPFSSANYVVQATPLQTTVDFKAVTVGSQSAGTCYLNCWGGALTASDPSGYFVAFFGDQ